MATSAATWAATSHAGGAPTTTTPCSSVTYSLSVSSTSQSDLNISVNGQIDFANNAATAAVALPAGLPFGLGGTTENVVFVGGNLYLAVPPALQSFVGGASWVYIALPASVNTALDSLDTMLASWCGNGQALESLLGSRGVSSQSLGSSTVGGVTVNGTELKTSGRRIARLGKIARRVDHHLPALRPRTPVTFDMWTTPQGGLTQLSATLGSFDVTLSLTNIDGPVNITAPAGAVPLPSAAAGVLGGFLSRP